MLWRSARGGKRRWTGLGGTLRLGAIFICILSAAGCDVNGLIDIGDSLLDPDAALLDHPGRQLVEGRYSGLKIAGSSESGGYVLARREDTDDQRVAVVPFLKGEPCEYAPAFDYDRFSSRIDIELPGALSVQVDQSASDPNFGTVRFIDYECQEVIEEIPNTILPGVPFPGVDPFGMLVRSADGSLYFIDAKERTHTLVASDVDYAVISESFMFSLEAGEVVVRDDSLEVVDRVGTGAVGMVATGGSRLPVVFEDETGIHTWSEDDGLQLLAEDGCSLWYTSIDSIAYYEPCDTRTLAIRAPSDAVFDSADEDAFVTLRGPALSTLGSLKFSPGSSTYFGELSVLTREVPGPLVGSLHVLTVPSDAESDASEIELSDLTLGEEITFVANHGLYYQDYADSRGTLLDFERDEDDHVVGLVEVARGVAWVPFGNPYSYRGILADYDGKEGRLIRVSRTEEGVISRKVLGEEVPFQSFVGDYETGLVAYVSALDSERKGILTLVDELGPYEVADQVPVDEIRLLDDPHGVVFLQTTEDSEIFELHAWLIEAELDLTIHKATSEHLTIPWPSPGVLYSVPEGDDAGLWFAKAR